MTDDDTEGRAAMQYVIDEMNAQWQSALADYAPKSGSNRALLVLAIRWIRIFVGEQWDGEIMAGLPIGNVLDIVARAGYLKLPQEVQMVRDQWYEKIVAYDIALPRGERRHTPEGQRAARDEQRKWEREEKARKRQQAGEERQRKAKMRELYVNYDEWAVGREHKLILRQPEADPQR